MTVASSIGPSLNAASDVPIMHIHIWSNQSFQFIAFRLSDFVIIQEERKIAYLLVYLFIE